MLQQVQSSTDIPCVVDIDSNDDHSKNTTLKVITCSICQAVYLPAFTRQRSTQDASRALEAAFLRACHFCFRCQRPACPQCWNPVHHVCVACGKEAHLPFLLPVPSLEGVILAPAVPPTPAQMTDLPLVCLHNGRFCLTKAPFSAKTQTITPHELPLRIEPKTLTSTLEAQNQPVTPAKESEPLLALAHASYPAWLQDIMDRQAPECTTPSPVPAALQQREEESIYTLSSTPEHVLQDGACDLAIVQERTPEAAWPLWGESTMLQECYGTLAEAVAQAQPARGRANLVEWIENTLIVVLATLLLALVLMIALAVRSASMNTFFLHLLHVDIRAEIMYLFQAI